ncbi:DNA mismatch repair protein MutS [Candidatus Poribacteria bacterium]|nr:DNA mismatch repair protein MutS [Candidatus Poribacteria bacterium]
MAKKLTLMEQYRRIKSQYPDAILFYRVGDFYETFYEDAKIASRVLGIALTSRDKDDNGKPVPLAGVPHHAVESYLYKMVKAGYKVAICEQVEDPKKAKGVVKREVVRIVTPGTIFEPEALEHKENNYLVALCRVGEIYGLAHVDLSTGEFHVTELEDEDKLISEITRLRPSELLIPEGFESETIERVRSETSPVVNPLPSWQFDVDTARSELLSHFDVLSLEGFGCEGKSAAISAAGALIQYLKETQKQQLQHILSLKTYSLEEFMILDTETQRNLELIRSIRDGSTKGTLIEILDETVTPMGGRKLRQMILRPLLRADEINARLDAVQELFENLILRDELRELLREIRDIERLIAKVGLGSANARDLLALRNSLKLVPQIKEKLGGLNSSLLQTIRDQLEDVSDVVDLIDRAIHEDPPITIREGGIIKDGYNSELDELRAIVRDVKGWIAGLQQKERERTGISSLRIGYNKVFGYYIEVTKPNLHLVPEDYIRKQTLVNAERFITPDLKEQEAKILNAQDRINDLEYELFCEVRSKVAEMTEVIQRIAAAIAMLDVLATFAHIAAKNNYARPQVDEGDEVIIRDGRHPVVERLFTREGFVPNDTYLNCSDRQMCIITGPNMSGKSTFLRQTALICLMAQIGSFVPASAAKIGVVDRIFTRVGASDSLVTGQSTFLVEMNETANILNNATRKSLIILDEIGRGTSTFDGISIAWAVAEYILQHIGAKTLFATHYHELTELAGTYKNVKNYNVAVHDDGERVVFLRKVVEGATDKSYGIHVAKLAGLPMEVIGRANEILGILESHNISVEGGDKPAVASRPRIKRRSRPSFRDDSLQLLLFTPQPNEIIEELKKLDLNNMTPIQALNKLYELKLKVEKER